MLALIICSSGINEEGQAPGQMSHFKVCGTWLLFCRLWVMCACLAL